MLLPLVLAAPLVALVPGIGLGGGYFEMLSCLTTTGATLFDRPQLLAEPLHLWRALVGWMGGLMVLVTAFAILAPLNLGGFEIGQAGAAGRARRGAAARSRRRAARILRTLRAIAPVYAGLTGALALLLILAGDTPVRRALPRDGDALDQRHLAGRRPRRRRGRAGSASWRSRVFLLPAVSHPAAAPAAPRRLGALRLTDPQVQLMLISVLGVTAVLFLRSFVGAAEIDRQDNLAAALQAIWGSLFTVLSFLTTTGFESHDWRAMQLWSDLPDPGIDPARGRGDGRRHRHHRRRGQAPAALRALPPRPARDGQAHPPVEPRPAGAGGPADLRGRRAHRLHLPDAVPDRARAW